MGTNDTYANIEGIIKDRVEDADGVIERYRKLYGDEGVAMVLARVLSTSKWSWEGEVVKHALSAEDEEWVKFQLVKDFHEK